MRVRYPVGASRRARRRQPRRVAAGERVGVAGRTGAGKSTLALAAAGLHPAGRPGDGRRAACVGDDRPRRRRGRQTCSGRVGIVFSTPANQLSASKLTVREELAFGLENLGVPRAEMDAPDRRGARAAGHRAPRRPRAVRAVGRRAAARGDRQHRRDGHARRSCSTSRPRSSTRPAREAVADLLARAGPRRARRCSCAEHDPAVLGRDGPVPRPRRGAGRRVRHAGPCARHRGARRRWARSRRRSSRSPSGRGRSPRPAFDEAAIAAALGGAARRPPDGRPAARPTRGRGRPAAAAPPVPIVAVGGLVHRYPGGVEALRGVDLTHRAGRDGRDRRPERVGQDHAREASQRPAPTDRRAASWSAARTSPASRSAELARDRRLRVPEPRRPAVRAERRARGRVRAANLGLAPGDVAAPRRGSARRGRPRRRRARPTRTTSTCRLRKLVALASVLAMDPAVLVLDEPTTGQDGPGIARVGAIVDALPGGGPDGGRDHPRHGVRGATFRADRRHAPGRGRRRWAARERVRGRRTASSSRRPVCAAARGAHRGAQWACRSSRPTLTHCCGAWPDGPDIRRVRDIEGPPGAWNRALRHVARAGQARR